MPITSPQNPLLKTIRRAVASGRALEDGRVVIEGPHLLEESLGSGWQVEQVLTTAHGQDRHQRLLARVDVDVMELPARAFAALSGTQTSREIMALVTPRLSTWAECLDRPGVMVIVDGLQDPGNAGTIVRSAEAFGAGSVIFLEGSVHVANGKFLRATAGSIFRMPYLENQKRPDLVSRLQANQRKLYALMPGLSGGKGVRLGAANLLAACALAVGSEAHGVSPEVRACAHALSIPTNQVESLNAGVACSIVLFEAARQRGNA
jgi:TrmH family RNA methyltransferase